MALTDDSLALKPANWPRAIEAHVPSKAFRDALNRLRFGADAPLSDECLWVDPQAIRHRYRPDPARGAPPLRRRASGKVLAGDWDLSRVPLEETVKSRSCRMHFIDGVPWEDTPIWAHLRACIARGERPDELGSEADMRDRYAALDRAFAQIRADGRLRPKSEMADFFRREHGGILVHVARDGTLLRASGGIHRLALSQILDLPRIPVQLGVTHLDAVRAGILQSYRRRDG